MSGQMDEYAEILDAVSEAIYGGGNEPEWLTTVDSSPNSAAYEHAYRALAALPRHDEWRVLCEHGMVGPFDTLADAQTSADRDRPCESVRIERRTVTEVRIEQAWVPSEIPTPPGDPT